MRATRHNEGKPRMSLLPFEALIATAQVFTFGEAKYGSYNWRKGMRWSYCVDSLLRHLEAYQRGEDLDNESGLWHTAHMACNCLFLLTYQILGIGEDDRYGENARCE